MFDHQRIFCSFLLLCIFSSKVSVKTEFLPQFEERVRTNITVQELWTKIFSILALARTVISQTENKKINSRALQVKLTSQIFQTVFYSGGQARGNNLNKMSGLEVMEVQRLAYIGLDPYFLKWSIFPIEVRDWWWDVCWVWLYCYKVQLILSKSSKCVNIRMRRVEG